MGSAEFDRVIVWNNKTYNSLSVNLMCSTSMRNDDLRAEILTQYFEMLRRQWNSKNLFSRSTTRTRFPFSKFFSISSAKRRNLITSFHKSVAFELFVISWRPQSRHVTIYLLSSKHVASHFTFPIRCLIISGTEIFYWNEKSWPRNSMKRRRRNVSEFMIMTVAAFHMF